ncbi:MAG: response regulator [Proteobacteria bacterium]|nr:response regulator [Pseudomonadota bacterium]MBU1687220.1 response regulator [Pseudomonadota bacterium]
MKPREEIRVLVTEDDFFIKKVIITNLEHRGYQVAGSASNGKEAVALVHELKPDIVIMDLQMPVMDGLEATRLIQEQCPTPVIVLTAYETMDLVSQATDAGASAYLVKPSKPDEIDRTITVALARHHDLMKIQELYRQVEAQRAELQLALTELKTLRGIIPICMYCKQIRDDEGYWNQVEKYITEHSQAKFSHGICPTCFEEKFAELEQDTPKKPGGDAP